MAGNIVKWWKHKILGGYKQFSVQECTTDSEELMYHQVRAPSSCSAPPDLLLVSDRENNIPLKSPVVNIITTATTSSSSQKQQHHHHHQQQQQQQLQHQQQQHNTKEHLYNKNVQNMKISNNKSGGRPINLQSSAAMSSHTQQQQSQQQQNEANQQQFRHHTKEEPRIHLEEFTCDVSVEGGKSTQPLQFSFTFYDLDGHHGKITKDDIVGIVYTIYESIGKSVVVPHCGSKTINVRLTVSPEGKSKASANKLKKMQPDSTTLLESCKAPAATAASALQGHARRQHRYRPRKLIKSDDEDDDSISEKDIQLTAMAASASANKSKSHASKYNNRAKAEQPEQLAATVAGECCQTMENNRNLGNNIDMSASSCQHDSNLYENIRTTNLKCCPTKDAKKCGAQVTEECRECAATTLGGGVQYKSSDVYLKQASSRVRMLRKARKQKYQDHCLETRQRSLSLGSEACWKSRHAKHSPQLAQPTTAAVDASKQQPLQSQQHSEDVLDGVQLRKPHRLGRPNSLAANRSSAECWKSAMNRSDLITIIRESMEKNRLSFQMNGKPQASVSPIRQSHQRQRSNTVSKIPTLIAHHNSSITSHNNSSTHPHSPSSKPINNEPSIHDINSSSTNCQHQPHQLQQQQQQQPSPHSHHHLQPHIPIYHQHMAINPAVLAAQSGFVHSKTNLCGYDSFLHATICGGGTSHSPPPPPPAPNGSHVVAHTQQPIAAVQPIMNAINAAASAGPKLSYHQQQQRYHQHPSPKIYAHPTSTQQQIKTSKILRSGTFSQTQQHPAAAAAPAATTTTAVVQQSSPQYHGYQRLASASATKHNLAALNSQNPSMARAQVEHLERWLHEREKCAAGALKSQKSKKDVKNYDNLLFAKLTEKLQDSTLNAADEVETEKRRLDIEQRRKQRAFARAQKGNGLANNSAHHNSPGRKSNPVNQQPQQQQQLQPQMILSPVTSEQSNYAALVPINGDPIECENLLGSQTSDEDNSAETPATKDATADGVAKETSALLQVTGDLLDFNDEADAEAEADAVKKQAQVLHVEGSASNMNSEAGRTSSSSNSSGAAVVATCPSNAAHNSNASSSLIHRYVHEHIHHHYHHFEDKAE